MRRIALLWLVLFAGGCASSAAIPDKGDKGSITSPRGLVDRLEVAASRPWSASMHERGSHKGSLLAVTSHRDGYLGLWAIDKNRTLHPLDRNEAVGFHPDEVRWVDWDGDGESTELLVAAEGEAKIQLWRYRDGRVQLVAAQGVADAPRDVVAADLDGDGYQDLVVGPYDARRVQLLWGKGNFEFNLVFLDAQPTPSHPKIVDWDGDGRLDIVWSDWDAGSVRWARNLGNRKIDIRLLQEPGHGAPRQIEIGDLDGDGSPDLVMALEVAKAARVLYNDGHGGVARQEEIPAPIAGYSDVAITGSGPTAMLAFSEVAQIVLARRDEQGTWQLRNTKAGNLPLSLEFADADGDGIQDLIFANSSGNTVEIVFGPLWENAEELILQ